jgi:hypothetical protein
VGITARTRVLARAAQGGGLRSDERECRSGNAVTRRDEGA